MAEQTPNPNPEKTEKNRSMGSFFIFLFILIVVLAMVGGDTLHRTEPLSQDEFLWSLHTGQIDKLEIKGTESGSNLIEGTYRNLRSGEPERFEVRFADVKESEHLYQQLKAVRKYRHIEAEDLLEAIDEGWYSPITARSLTAFKEREVIKPADSGEDSASEDEPKAPAPAPKIDSEERLIVRVMARSEESWNETRGISAGPPNFPLEAQSGNMWFDVDLSRVNDLGAILGSIENRGANVERLQFDLTKGQRWFDSQSALFSILIYTGPWILIIIVFMFFMRQMRSQGGAGGVMSFGRSRAQLYSKDNVTTNNFDDVAGMEEAKSEVRELVEFLKNPGRFTRIGGRIPRGVLLVGPPGCGKTLLAKAIAGEAEVPFFSISGSDFVEMFVGVGASRVRDLFKQARDNSPCIIFLDEIDAVGRRRGSGMGGGHDEREQTLNAILVEMDGFGTDQGIIVVAATNRPDVLDPALLRPGRFDREVVIELPDYEERKAILDVHLKRVKAVKGLELDSLARSTPGFSGADLAAIVNEAAIMAVLAKLDEVHSEHLDESRDKVRYGRQRRSHKIEEEDRKITAFHESGHAVVAAVMDEVDSPHKVTIIPRGRALGSTMTIPQKESYHMQKKRLLGQLAVLFGGRVAEAEFCGDISAGASDDIKRATDLARTMVGELGMSDKIGPINYAERQGSDFLGTELMRGKQHSEETARLIDEEVQSFLNTAYETATRLVREHREHVQSLTDALLKYETVTGEEVLKLIEGVSIEALRPEPEVEETAEDNSAAEEKNPQDSQSDDRTGDLPGNDLPGNAGFSPA